MKDSIAERIVIRQLMIDYRELMMVDINDKDIHDKIIDVLRSLENEDYWRLENEDYWRMISEFISELSITEKLLLYQDVKYIKKMYEFVGPTFLCGTMLQGIDDMESIVIRSYLLGEVKPWWMKLLNVLGFGDRLDKVSRMKERKETMISRYDCILNHLNVVVDINGRECSHLNEMIGEKEAEYDTAGGDVKQIRSKLGLYDTAGGDVKQIGSELGLLLAHRRVREHICNCAIRMVTEYEKKKARIEKQYSRLLAQLHKTGLAD